MIDSDLMRCIMTYMKLDSKGSVYVLHRLAKLSLRLWCLLKWEYGLDRLFLELFESCYLPILSASCATQGSD